MKRLKRITAAFLALLSTLSVAAGCGKSSDKESVSSPTASVESAGGTNSTDSTGATPVKKECVDPVKGHDYSEKTGLCIRCNEKAVIPALPSGQEFPLAEPCTHPTNSCPVCEYTGKGTEYDRLELFEDCYTVEIGQSGVLWLSFSVESAGQYVLYSVGGANGVTVTRHNANAQYVPPEGSSPVIENGNFYGYVNCGKGYYNKEWRATYCLRGAANTQVQLCFVKIDVPAWEPMSVTTKMYPEEINGKKAPEMSDEMRLVAVNYDSSYFYSDPKKGGDGYYHLGTEENPGDIIFVAIDAPAERLFSEGKFTEVLKNFGTALTLNDGYTEDGNYNMLCYTPFIMNWKDENAAWGSRPGVGSTETGEPEGDPNKNAYQNYCNSDGVYPVNAELFKFLNLYVKENKPTDPEISLEDWTGGADWMWLSACYTYKLIEVGTEDNPLKLEADTPITFSVERFLYYYCTLTEAGTYTLACSDANVKVSVDGADSVACNGVTITVTDTPVVLQLSGGTVAIEGATLTATKN